MLNYFYCSLTQFSLHSRCTGWQHRVPQRSGSLWPGQEPSWYACRQHLLHREVWWRPECLYLSYLWYSPLRFHWVIRNYKYYIIKVYPYCSTQWAKGYTFFFLFISLSLKHFQPYRSNSFSSQVLPTCLAPSCMSGFLPWLSFHFNNWDISSLSIR